MNKEKQEPLNISIEKAQEELMLGILAIQDKYQFPSYIMELILNGAMLDIKTYSNREMKNGYESQIEELKKEIDKNKVKKESEEK